MAFMDFVASLKRGVMAIPRKLFGTRNDRLLKRYVRAIPRINALEKDIRGDFDQRFAERIAAGKVDEAPAEEQPAIRQRIRVELSGDLRARTDGLRERLTAHYQPLREWWNGLAPADRVNEYVKQDYRKRNLKIIEKLDAEGITAEAFAVLREASRRAQNHRHFDCQLVGGRVLYEGRIAEMKTGEGKTIVCHLAAFLNSISGLKVHVITVNDYLVKRDAEFARPIFELVGVTVGYIQAQHDPGGREGLRKQAYDCDITYGTNSEFGFDYLRDNMKTRLEDQVQGRLDFVIVDEVDSILVDEARTPLIISGPADDDVTRYPRADKVAEELVRRQVTWDRKLLHTVARFDGDAHNIPKLPEAMAILGYREKKGAEKAGRMDQAPGAVDHQSGEVDAAKMATLGPDFLTDDMTEAVQFYENEILKLPAAEQYRRYFIVQVERKQVGITHEGVTFAQELLDIGSLYAGGNMEWPHLIENALRAHKVYRRDVDYVVQDGQIIIVDPFTGRLMHGRQWSDGLHQSVEAKEHVRVKEETQTLATITIQNFIKLYIIKSGMTGTAMTEATEFDKIYKLEVVEIPTNRPVNRADHNDKMYRNVEQKFDAIVEEIQEVHRRGRPADPFLMHDLLRAVRPVQQRLGKDTGRIDEAIRQFSAAELNDNKVIRFMVETYDEAMGDLARGRPVLVGTTSVENSEKISRLLGARYGIDHEVLNAKNHAREADIVAKAGFTSLPVSGGDQTLRGHVTIATNMAGRGTDIKLGPGVVYEGCKVPQTLPAGIPLSVLFPPGTTKCCVHCTEYDPATNCAHCYKPRLDPRFPEMGRKVCTLNVPCGLHIIGTERHESRRIDNQLRGRSGRQGDPGSSRFSLSLQDDLLKLFMSDWMLKMMERLGFTDGTSLEDKRLSKGIERAQRKVEERNFSTRKHLLEWDEPMDYQRKEFYAARQRILERRDLPGLILDTMENTIDSTLQQMLGGGYVQTCISEWCRAQREINVAEDVIDTGDLESAQKSIRRRALDDAHEAIRTSLGEYIDSDEPPAKWDVGGLAQWAQRQFKVSLTQNNLRRMQPGDIEETLIEAASRYAEDIDLSGIAIYLDPHFPPRALADWAKAKFNIRVEKDELIDVAADSIRALLLDRVREAYRERELSYPVESCLERALGPEGNADGAAAAQFVVQWANAKFNVNWTLADVQGKPVPEIHDQLLALNRRYWTTELDAEVERAAADRSREALLEWAQQRFGPVFDAPRLAGSDGDLKAALLQQGREMLRWELTRLEQFVLLRIYDQAWKDHLLEMDHLKTAIMQRHLGGDQSHPQSQYAIEGRGLFGQMLSRISARVTDIIFKVRVSGSESVETAGTSGGAKPLTFRHAEATGAGFAGATADQAAAMRAQGVENKVETIRREQPRVGRNEPCPCGSGKKYKSCHGKT